MQYPVEIQLIRDGLEGKVRFNENPTNRREAKRPTDLEQERN
jgi:hypothetical protein